MTKSTVSTAAWASLLLVLIAAVQSAPTASPRWNVTASESCTTSAPEHWMTGRATTLSDGKSVMATNSVIQQEVCGAGTLRFSARGTPADGRFPLVSVSLGDKPLLTFRATEDREYEVTVPGSGVLTLTFHNDAYHPSAKPPEDRNVFVQDFTFTPE